MCGRYQFSADGHVVNLSCIFSVGWFRLKKLAADCDPHRCVVCPVGFFILTMGVKLVLADFSRYRSDNKCRGCGVLSSVSYGNNICESKNRCRIIVLRVVHKKFLSANI